MSSSKQHQGTEGTWSNSINAGHPGDTSCNTGWLWTATRAWDALPLPDFVTAAPNVASFSVTLKTYLFSRSFWRWQRITWTFVTCYWSAVRLHRANLAPCLLSVPRHDLLFCSRAFHTSAPKIWSSLPPHVLQSQTLSSFRHYLKTHYFQSAYPAP